MYCADVKLLHLCAWHHNVNVPLLLTQSKWYITVHTWIDSKTCLTELKTCFGVFTTIM